jgi:hypothetical protein
MKVGPENQQTYYTHQLFPVFPLPTHLPTLGSRYSVQALTCPVDNYVENLIAVGQLEPVGSDVRPPRRVQNPPDIWKVTRRGCTGNVQMLGDHCLVRESGDANKANLLGNLTLRRASICYDDLYPTPGQRVKGLPVGRSGFQHSASGPDFPINGTG